MKKKLYYVVIIYILLYLFLVSYLIDNERTKLQEKNHKDTEEKMQTGYENYKTDMSLYSDLIGTILEKNHEMEVEFLNQYPTALRWIQISTFDYEGDGRSEIILSNEYVQTSAVISCNKVYDDCGNFLFGFLSGDILGTEIFVDETKSQYYIQSNLHIGASQDVILHEEIYLKSKWEVKLMFVEWDCRHGKEREKNEQDGYFIYDCFTPEEVSIIMSGDYENMIGVFRSKEANGTTDQLQKYVQSFEGQQKETVTAIGSILDWEEGINWILEKPKVLEWVDRKCDSDSAVKSL